MLPTLTITVFSTKREKGKRQLCSRNYKKPADGMIFKTPQFAKEKVPKPY